MTTPLQRRLGGVCAATLTPLNEQCEPDHAALVAHCRRLLSIGCDAINLLGTTGEATSLSLQQRLEVMEAIASSGLPLERFMVGTGAAAFADALTLTRAAVRLGFAGALVIPPFYFKNVTDEGVFAYYERLITQVDHAGLLVYLYHFPQLSGFAFSAALVDRLARAFPRTIAGIKDSSGASGFAESIVAACPQLDVFPSSESVLAHAAASGFAGCISATVNVSAPLAARVWAGASDVHAPLSAIRQTIAKHQLVPALRAVLASLSGDGGWRRMILPLVELPAAEVGRLVGELDAQPEFASIRETFAHV